MKRIKTLTIALVTATAFLGAAVLSGPAAGAKLRAEDDEPELGCTDRTLKGTYGFFRSGTTSQGPLAAVGIATYDGNGFSHAVQTISRNGVFTENVVVDAPYRVNADCTAELLTLDGRVTGRFAIVDSGREYYLLSMSPGNAVVGTAKRTGRVDEDSDGH